MLCQLEPEARARRTAPARRPGSPGIGAPQRVAGCSSSPALRLTWTPSAQLAALLRAYVRFPEIGGRAAPPLR
jgi:hypothetical protein